MYFTQVAILALAAVAQAVPAVSPNVTPLESVTTSSPLPEAGDVSARAVYTVTLCTELNFRGACSYFSGNTGVCYELPANYNNRISSLRLRRRCTFWANAGCRGPALVLDAGNYPRVPGRYNDIISSYACQ